MLQCTNPKHRDISGKQDKNNCIDIDPETLYKLPAIKDKAVG
mgnify:CR=1 FL=1